MGTPYKEIPMFVVGDLVFFLGHQYFRDEDMIGVVVEVKYDLASRADPLYEVYWFQQRYTILHSGMQLELVYECDSDEGDVKINLS